MIIFGTRGITYTKDRGSFHCPDCGDSQPYRQKRVRRFFTLYFIPLIPLDRLGEFVECETCRSTFAPAVLEYDPAAAEESFRALYHEAMKRVMVEVSRADGQIDDAEVQVISDVYLRLTGSALTDAEVRAEADRAAGAGQAAGADLRALAPTLNEHGKEMVIRAALLVAGADGTYQDEEWQLILSLREDLDMSTAHFNGVVESMASAA